MNHEPPTSTTRGHSSRDLIVQTCYLSNQQQSAFGSLDDYGSVVRFHQLGTSYASLRSDQNDQEGDDSGHRRAIVNTP